MKLNAYLNSCLLIRKKLDGVYNSVFIIFLFPNKVIITSCKLNSNLKQPFAKKDILIFNYFKTFTYSIFKTNFYKRTPQWSRCYSLHTRKPFWPWFNGWFIEYGTFSIRTWKNTLLYPFVFKLSVIEINSVYCAVGVAKRFAHQFKL